jgi:hypothetical protein
VLLETGFPRNTIGREIAILFARPAGGIFKKPGGIHRHQWESGVGRAGCRSLRTAVARSAR